MSQRLDLSEFPFDKHTFIIRFAAATFDESDINFVPGASPEITKKTGGTVSDQVSLPDWHILNSEAEPDPYKPIEGVNVAGFVLQFNAKRYYSYHLWQIVLPMTIVVMMSWASFWIPRDQVGVRIGVPTSSILTLIAHRFVLASLLPRLPYMTRLDYFSVGSTLLVFLCLLGVVFTAYLGYKDRDMLARKVDLLARVAMPVTYAFVFVWLFHLL